MSAPTLAIVAAGAMGAAVARRLTTAGCIILTNLDGRSPATRARAAAAGMHDVPMVELAARARWVLSILPPSDALAFAARFKDAHAQSRSSQGATAAAIAFADCNAVSPETVKRIAALFTGSGVGFVDAGIIGGPPREGYDPVFYASVAPEDSALLEEFAGLKRWGLNVSLLKGEGAGVGDASALKMSYAGISKGIIGLCSTMILAAHASSPATAQALLHELSASQPAILQRITKSVPNMLPKAYRWVGEMEEISAFVGGGEAQVHRGLAALYARIERSLQEERKGEEGGEDVRVLRAFVEDAKRVVGQGQGQE
ncbi:6-phosphogluconate dehydrogenase C-terminal domain-like protein [Wolfiporia cocos MD-104 SS10]|uniref:6-phosphogluconate dehydrogenase C-terminal domain-like protein n=1 Tax=Wolfiporia cocos (strain MD-104) TaxID=742152 RepID=A0A2H3JPK5_WOLCO|nr:6-phosphogluconate dehydrogenase C-terminal domain-like protein [Wolfiporia cocos MD-104 SS10]